VLAAQRRLIAVVNSVARPDAAGSSWVHTLLDDTRSGHGTVLLLTGEAGIGKSHLARRIAGAGRNAGMVTVTASAGLPGAPPLWPWRTILSALADALPELRFPELPAERDADGTGRPGDLRARFELFASIGEAFRQAAISAPLVLVLDDLHAADLATVLLVQHLVPIVRDSAVLVVSTVRDDVEFRAAENAGGPAEPRESTWADLIRESRVVKLSPLGPAQVAAMVEAATGRAAGASTVDRILARTGGNALFVRELVALAASGDDTRFEDLPPTIRAVVRARLAELPSSSADVLGTASVLGTTVPMALLAAALGATVEDVARPLEDATRRGLVSVGPSVARFSHEIVRDAVYDALPLSARLRWHARVAECLSTSNDPQRGSLATVAEHFSLAGPDHAAAATRWWELAGDAAMATLAYEDAARCFQRALTTAGWNGRLLARLGDAELAAGRSAAARTAYLGAVCTGRLSGDAVLVARAALGLGSGPAGFEVTLLDREQIEALELALRLLPTEQPALRAMVLARLSVALTFTGTDERRRTLAAEALEAAASSGNDTALGIALAARCDVIGGPEHLAERLQLTDRIVGLAQGTQDAALELVGRRMRLVARLEAGETALVADEMRSFAAVARMLAQPLYLWYVPLWQGALALAEGRFDDCRSAVSEAERLGAAAGSVNAGMLCPTLRWCLAVDSSDQAALVELVGSVSLERFEGAWVPFAHAMMTAQLGDIALARRRLDAVLLSAPSLPRDGNWLATVCQVAETLALVGPHPVAGWVYEALTPFAELFVVEGTAAALRGSVHRQLGQAAAALGHRAEATEHFRRAVDADERAGLPALAALGRQQAASAGVDALGRQQAANAGLDVPVGRAGGLAATSLMGGPDGDGKGNVFRLDGETWTVRFAGRTVGVRDSKGMHDLARLLTHPGRQLPAVELAAGPLGSPTAAELLDGDQRLGPTGDLGEVVDATARAAYRQRLDQLEQEALDADLLGDQRRSAAIAAEREALMTQLSAAYGIGGRVRRTGSPAERARTAVTARIRDAVGRIERAHPELGRHLRVSVRTGAFCGYEPETETRWLV
jgi:tetratricopeptide (TPR) repeat protein